MRSEASNVDAYLAQSPPEHAASLRALRERARAKLPDHEERMHWGMPAYLCQGRVSFGFAAQKKYVSLYFRVPSVLSRYDEALQGIPRGKGCLRFRRAAEMNWPLIDSLLEDTRAGAPAPP